MDHVKPAAKFSRACNSCKEKKRRCDRASPKCGYCSRNGLQCEFRALQKPGLPMGYGSTLLEKFDVLDSTVQEFHQSSMLELQAVMDHLKHIDLKVLQIVAREHGSPRQTLTTDSLNSNNTGKFQGGAGFLPENASNTKMAPSWPLPRAEVISKLVDVFFEKIYPGFRALHPTFREDILDKVPQIEELSDACKVPPQILGIVACSLRFAGDLILPEQLETYLTFCRTTILTQCIGFSLIEQLQAMALLAYDSYGRSNNPQTWSYISLIANAVIHLNLTREPVGEVSFQEKPNLTRSKKAKIISPQGVANFKAPTDSFDEECRRNLFWEIFLLDCFSSVSNSLPCKIIETDINRQVPVRLEVWESPTSDRANSVYSNPGEFEHLDSASFLVEVVRKLRRIHTFLREPFDISNVKEVLAWQMQLSEIDTELTKWKESIPLQYRSFLDHQSVAFTHKLTVKDVLFFSIYHMTIIRLNSSVAYQKFDSNFFLLSSTAKKKCLDSANSIASFSARIPTLLNCSSGSTYAICGPFYAFTLWVAARLLFVDALRSGDEFPSELDQLISVLSSIGGLWESASRYSDILSFLKNEEIENRANGRSLMAEINGFGTLDESNTDSDIKDPSDSLANHSKSARIFADMRFNAYSLDVSLSKKIEQSKKNGEEMSPNNKTDFMNLLEWFKIPISMENSPFVPQMEL